MLLRSVQPPRLRQAPQLDPWVQHGALTTRGPPTAPAAGSADQDLSCRGNKRFREGLHPPGRPPGGAALRHRPGLTAPQRRGVGVPGRRPRPARRRTPVSHDPRRHRPRGTKKSRPRRIDRDAAKEPDCRQSSYAPERRAANSPIPIRSQQPSPKCSCSLRAANPRHPMKTSCVTHRMSRDRQPDLKAKHGRSPARGCTHFYLSDDVKSAALHGPDFTQRPGGVQQRDGSGTPQCCSEDPPRSRSDPSPIREVLRTQRSSEQFHVSA